LRGDRYSRQLLLPEIRQDGQRKLAKSRAVVIGCGALGTNALSFLVRAGVGQVAVVDRDLVELSNLQRQALFEEGDVGRPKAKVAEKRLRMINSEIAVRGIIAEVDPENVEKLVRGASVVLDAADNMETRFMVNDACAKHGIPWVYAGAVGVTGMVMAVVPGGPCLRCVFPTLPKPGQLPTCDTVGILNTLPSAVASLEVTEAFKVMLGREPGKELLVLDLWQGDLQKIKVRKNPECGTCVGRDFRFLRVEERGKAAASPCGENAVHIRPAKKPKGGLSNLRKTLALSGKVKTADGVLRFKARGAELTVFPDGRAIVHGTGDPSKAMTIYSKYLGD